MLPHHCYFLGELRDWIDAISRLSHIKHQYVGLYTKQYVSLFCPCFYLFLFLASLIVYVNFKTVTSYYWDKDTGMLFVWLRTQYDRVGDNYCGNKGCESVQIVAGGMSPLLLSPLQLQQHTPISYIDSLSLFLFLSSYANF